MKILILNLIPNTIGDNLFLTPMFRILKKNYATSSLDVTVSSLNYELFENNKNIDKQFIGIDILVDHIHKKVVTNKGFQILASKKPLITMESPAAAESGLDNNENCILVPPADPQRLADAILSILNNPQKREQIATNVLHTTISELTGKSG